MPPSLIPTRYIELRMPVALLDAVDARLYDPVLGKRAYGHRSHLILRLLQEWVDRTPLNPSTPTPSSAPTTLSRLLEVIERS